MMHSEQHYEELKDLIDWAMLLIEDNDRSWATWLRDAECFISEFLDFEEADGDDHELNNLAQKVCRIIGNYYLEKTKALQRFSPLLIGTVINGHELYFWDKYNAIELEGGVHHRISKNEAFIWDIDHVFIHVKEDPFQSYLTNSEEDCFNVNI